MISLLFLAAILGVAYYYRERITSFVIVLLGGPK